MLDTFSTGWGRVNIHVPTHSSDGWASVAAYFEKELEPSGRGTAAQIVLATSGTVTHQPEATFGITGGLTDKQEFVVPDGAGHWCRFDPAELELAPLGVVRLDLCCTAFKATVLLEWLILPIAHYALAGDGCAPMHASGAWFPGQEGPILYSAWSGVGKTNLVLSALAKGAAFYGDDQVLVDSAGNAYPSSRRVSIYGYNRQLAPSLPMSDRLRLQLGARVHSLARRSRGRLAFLAGYAANGLGSTRASARELGGTVGAPSNVYTHVVCHSVKSDQSASLEPLSVTEDTPHVLAKAHTSVMAYEYVWFQRYLQTWRWATCSDLDPWATLEKQWTTNLTDYFSSVGSIMNLSLPKGWLDVDWVWGQFTRLSE